MPEETVFGQEVLLSGKIAKRVEKLANSNSCEQGDFRAFKAILRHAEEQFMRQFMPSAESSDNNNGDGSIIASNGRLTKKRPSRKAAYNRRSAAVNFFHA